MKKLRSSSEVFTRVQVKTEVKSGTMEIVNGEIKATANELLVIDGLPTANTIDKLVKEKFGLGSQVIEINKISEVREFKLSEIWDLGTKVEQGTIEE